MVLVWCSPADGDVVLILDSALAKHKQLCVRPFFLIGGFFFFYKPMQMILPVSIFHSLLASTLISQTLSHDGGNKVQLGEGR